MILSLETNTLTQTAWKMRIASLNDIPEVLFLNLRWNKKYIHDRRMGYLSVKYSYRELGEMIEKQEVLLYTLNEQVTGYALINSIDTTMHQHKVRELYLRKRVLEEDQKVVFGYQVLLDESARDQGIFSRFHNTMLSYFKSKFNLLVSTIQKDNIISINAHYKNDWIFYDTDESFFIIEH